MSQVACGVIAAIFTFNIFFLKSYGTDAYGQVLTSPYSSPAYATGSPQYGTSTGYQQDLMADELAMLRATAAAVGSTGMSYQATPPSGLSTYPSSYGTMAGGYSMQSPGMGAFPAGRMPTSSMTPPYSMTNSTGMQPSYGVTPVSIAEAESAFDDAALITLRTPKEDIVSTCLKLEKVFKGCNFAATAASTETGASTSALINKAVSGIQKLMNAVSPGYKRVIRKVSKKVSGDITPLPEDAAEQEKFIAMAYMITAAERNPSFKKGLTSHTVTPSARIFWQIHQQIFYVQPVCLRTTAPDGTFTENQIEKNYIDKLFQIEGILSEARSPDVELLEERAFIRGTRMLSSLIVDPTFIQQTSMGLKTFAFLLFKDGILRWLNGLKGSERSHDELWIVAAETFNLMYNAIVGGQLIRPTNLNSLGVNRANAFATDHLLCSPTKGSVMYELQTTTLGMYTKDLTAIANYFTKRTTDVASQAGFLAKNDSDLLLICLAAEACEYMMEESTAADGANLIGYFFEKGYMMNNRPVNWNSASNSIANFPCIVLDRLFQKTATSFLSSVKLIGSKSGSSSTFGGDYTADSVLQALLLNTTIAIESAGKSPVLATKASKSLAILRKNKASLVKNSKLKGFKLRPRNFANSPMQMPLLPAPSMARPGSMMDGTGTMMTGAGTVPGLRPQAPYMQPQQRGMVPGMAGRMPMTSSQYPQQMRGRPQAGYPTTRMGY